MDGNIFDSEGRHVAIVRGSSIYDLRGAKLYDLRGLKIYRLSGELVGHLGSSGSERRLDRAGDKLFPAIVLQSEAAAKTSGGGLLSSERLFDRLGCFIDGMLGGILRVTNCLLRVAFGLLRRAVRLYLVRSNGASNPLLALPRPSFVTPAALSKVPLMCLSFSREESGKSALCGSFLGDRARRASSCVSPARHRAHGAISSSLLIAMEFFADPNIRKMQLRRERPSNAAPALVAIVRYFRDQM